MLEPVTASTYGLINPQLLANSDGTGDWKISIPSEQVEQVEQRGIGNADRSTDGEDFGSESDSHSSYILIDSITRNANFEAFNEDFVLLGSTVFTGRGCQLVGEGTTFCKKKVEIPVCHTCLSITLAFPNYELQKNRRGTSYYNVY